MRLINILLALFISVLIGLVVFEGGLRLTRFAPEKSANQFDPELGWSKAPGAKILRSTSEFEAPIQINEQGLRDDPMPLPKKPAGVYRVLCLGDSFTMGYTVPREQLFVDLLEDWWALEGRKIEVINAGTEGYSTDQEARWLEVHGAAFEPDLVLVFPYENDIYWNGQKSYLRYPKPRYDANGKLETRKLVDPGPHRWTENFATMRALEAAVAGLRGGKDGPMWFVPEGSETPMLREFAPLLTAEPDFLHQGQENPKARTRGALIAMQRASQTLGAELVVVPIPSRSAVSPKYAESFGKRFLGLPKDAWSAERPVDFFLQLAGELGIKSLDVSSTFQAIEEAGQQLYYKLDWHLNEEGNRALASYLHRELESPKNAILPTELAAKTEVEAPPRPSGPWFPTWLRNYLVLWVVLSLSYKLTYRAEPISASAPKVAGMLALVFAVFFGGRMLAYNLPPEYAGIALTAVVIGILIFLIYKLGRRLGTIFELISAFIVRGHWYLLPLLVVLLSIGSLLVVAASSPFIAPFIYTLF